MSTQLLGQAFANANTARVTSEFAVNRTFGTSPHIGVDFGRPNLTLNSPLYAPFDIYEVSVLSERSGILGFYDSYGFAWRVVHLNAFNVRSGNFRKGALIGKVGTRNGAKPVVAHLHADVKPGRAPGSLVQWVKARNPRSPQGFLDPGSVYALHLVYSKAGVAPFRFTTNPVRTQMAQPPTNSTVTARRLFAPVKAYTIGLPVTILAYPAAIDYFSRLVEWTEGFNRTEFWGMTQNGFSTFVELADPRTVSYVAGQLGVSAQSNKASTANALMSAYYRRAPKDVLRLATIMHLASTRANLGVTENWGRAAIATYAYADLAYQRGPYHKSLPDYARVIRNWVYTGGSLSAAVNHVHNLHLARSPQALTTRWAKLKQVFG